MPILGLIDAATFSNAVGVTTGSATVTKNAADAIDAGDIIELSGVRYYVKSVDSTTQITLGSNYAAATNAALAGAVRRTAPKALADYIVGGGDSASADVQILGVSRAEAQLSENKSRGISGPGWWAYRTYTDAAGTTRHKAECIASFKDGSAVSGDASDDAAVGDVTSLITISSHSNQRRSKHVSGGALPLLFQHLPHLLVISLFSPSMAKLDVAGDQMVKCFWSNICFSRTHRSCICRAGDKYRVKVNNHWWC